MKIRCPICKRLTTWEENPFRPFCSQRCKLMDLGKWATEGYRVEPSEPSEPAEPAEKEEGRWKTGGGREDA
jgi:hypothetical protein